MGTRTHNNIKIVRTNRPAAVQPNENSKSVPAAEDYGKFLLSLNLGDLTGDQGKLDKLGRKALAFAANNGPSKNVYIEQQVKYYLNTFLEDKKPGVTKKRIFSIIRMLSQQHNEMKEFVGEKGVMGLGLGDQTNSIDMHYIENSYKWETYAKVSVTPDGDITFSAKDYGGTAMMLGLLLLEQDK